jgi:hypothetical protein
MAFFFAISLADIKPSSTMENVTRSAVPATLECSYQDVGSSLIQRNESDEP